ncbi:MAG: hypothetical protein ACYS8X_07900 [Planctomycetota bacterium]|jgi:hypothetical protein
MTTLKTVVAEIREHAPFTMFGALTGIAIMAAVVYGHVPKGVSSGLFWTLHPLHVLLSALATAGMYRLHGGRKLLPTIIIGYLGSVGIATVSDSVIPYLGELLLDMPHTHVHIGFIEKWWLINPLALVGIALACLWPKTKVPHAGHVLLSTWASLFHMTMAIGESLDWVTLVVVPVFLFLAVWIPCCLSDIVFPLLFCGEPACTCHDDDHDKD